MTHESAGLAASRPFADAAAGLVGIMGLERRPAAVFFVGPGEDAAPFAAWTRLGRHRYCQALMKASGGQSVVLGGDEVSCPAAAAAFGFKALPEGLKNGKGLVGFGIVDEAATGAQMFTGMSRLAPGSLSGLALCPLDEAPRRPDVVVVEGPPEQLMWLLLADVNLRGGDRLAASTAVLQATCVDAAIIPFVEQHLNFTLGCYGCREATDLAPGETVLGFPGGLLEPLVGRLRYLNEKAVPGCRAKRAFVALASGREAADDARSLFETEES